ncbi:Repressor ROX1 [Grifola frondosa]|uniref:Repressor ROX1 n=1 Tax=Grifola frondosa TaxID=5627 RepID=A0A1C7LSI1_GRIFR|nr:Repressor ROX1 [Grifola frondosa]
MPAHRTRDTCRTLEVATDVLPPPTVSIISPTPRAFTFPINDIRFSTPSSSPFEPLKSIPCTPPPVRAFSPTSSIGSDSSSILSSPSAPASSQASHKRRRSTASDIGERRPKKGDEDYIKRPENAFILFRRKCCEERQAALEEDDGASGPVKKQRQADLSKTISQQWKGLNAEEKQYWEDLAKEKKKEHEAMYPNYVYRPQRVKDKAKPKKGKGRKADGEPETDVDSVSFILPVPSPPRSHSGERVPVGHGHGHPRRAVSAPTPPPAFQTIKLPSVYMPSCPTSPTLIPRISRHSPLSYIPPPTDSDPLTRFEYSPNDTLFSFVIPIYFRTKSPRAFHFSRGIYENLFQVPDQHVVTQGDNESFLHSLNIPQDPLSMSANIVSPAESIASGHMLSPADSSMSSASSHCSAFTPSDALSMMSFTMSNSSGNQHMMGIPENIDNDVNSSELHFGVYGWSSESLWSNMEGILQEDFDLTSIPPVELGVSQFDVTAPSSSEYENGEFIPLSEENDFHDADSGLDPFSGMFPDEHMNW